MLEQLRYCYDCVFCVLISVCAKQDLWEDLGESLFDLAEKQKLLHSQEYLSFFLQKSDFKLLINKQIVQDLIFC